MGSNYFPKYTQNNGIKDKLNGLFVYIHMNKLNKSLCFEIATYYK